MSFSLSKFNKTEDEAEYERLKSLIKDPIDRKWILSSIDSRLSVKQKIKKLEHYIEYLDDRNKNKKPVLDLGIMKSGIISESFLRMFGFWIKKILERTFGMNSVPVNIRGTQEQITSFANALSKEKKYIENLDKLGLTNPQIYKNKKELKIATEKFTRKTRN